VRSWRSSTRVSRRFAPGVPKPLWTFTPNDKQALQIAFAVAVGPFGEIYAGGIGPAFAVIGG